MYVLLWLLLPFYCVAQENITVRYYAILINNTIADIKNYRRPTDNSKFTKGIYSTKIVDLGKFDFVIVGAGSAGSVLAERLSENKKFNILLLEAGGEENDFSKIPTYAQLVQFTPLNWGYLSTPQKNSCLGMKNNQCAVPRGMVLGGSSSLNGMMYVRGNPADYDLWGEEVDPTWSYQNCLPYFKKSENSQINGSRKFHGVGGLWNVEYSKPQTIFFDSIVQGNSELGLPYLDYNGLNQLGVSQLEINTKRGKRQSLSTAFLADARKRSNLHVITNALATKVLIDKQKIAKGVLFVNNNKKYKAMVSKEVIVSAGAINTPQLLILSGIGPKNHLKDLNIDIVANLPVGKNLIEHPMFVGFTVKTNLINQINTLSDQISQYLNGLGPLTLAANFEIVSFLNSRNTTLPVLEYLYQPPLGGNPSLMAKVYNINNELTNNYYSKMNFTTDISICIILIQPKSRGEITLKSKDPNDYPNIDLNMLDDPEDISTITEGIRFALNLLQTQAFRQLQAEFLDIPVCKNFTKYSNQYWNCVVRSLTSTVYHLCGTARMGLNPSTSVVDKDLKVHGVGNLRVVDASVIPHPIRGHTSAPTVMIAEKISEVMKATYQ